MRKYVGKSNERNLCKLSISEILRFFQSFMLSWKLRKRQILPVSQNLLSVYFLLAKFQLVSCNLPLVMIWQKAYTHKLPKQPGIYFLFYINYIRAYIQWSICRAQWVWGASRVDWFAIIRKILANRTKRLWMFDRPCKENPAYWS